MTSAAEHTFGKGEALTVGVEEEYMLLDATPFELVSRFDEVADLLEGGPLDGRAHPELMQSTLEVASVVCRNVDELRTDLERVIVGHAELDLGGSVIMLADESTEVGNKSPGTVGGTPVSLMVYVEDVDAVVRKAVAEGATITEELEDKFWGDRFGTITDPFGHVWSIGTHVEDVPQEEMAERAEAAMAATSS